MLFCECKIELRTERTASFYITCQQNAKSKILTHSNFTQKKQGEIEQIYD